MFWILKFLVKSTIWLAGVAVVSFFVMNYFGYDVNRNYFTERKADCGERLRECRNELIRQGTENAQCDFNCVNPKLIINKK